MKPLVETDEVQEPRYSSFERHLLSRADEHSREGHASIWRPEKEELLGWQKFKILFLFNLPFFLIGIGLLTAFLAKLWYSDPGENPAELYRLPTLLGLVAGTAAGAAVLDFLACNKFRRAWNKRARFLSQ